MAFDWEKMWGGITGLLEPGTYEGVFGSGGKGKPGTVKFPPYRPTTGRPTIARPTTGRPTTAFIPPAGADGPEDFATGRTLLAPPAFAQYGDEEGMGGFNSSPEAITALLKGAGAIGPAKTEDPPPSFLSKALGFGDKSGKSSYLTELGLRMASRKDKKGPLSFLTDPLLETYESQAKKEAAAAKFGLEKQKTGATVMSAKAAMEANRLKAFVAGKAAADKRKQNSLVLALRKNGLEADDFSTLAATNPGLMKKVMADAKEFYHVDFSGTMADNTGAGPNPAANIPGFKAS